MSDVQATPAAIAVPAEETVPTPAVESAPVTKTEETPLAVPATEPAVAAAVAAPAAVAAENETETKQVEPVTEGHLGYKAPGLLKQFLITKKEFWFSDEPVSPINLQYYLRGEKPDIAHPVVAYATQTGKGLLFFVKKGETSKTHPTGVLPLYDATDLRKSSPLEFTFRLHNQNHSFKAATEAERDGWYQSIEKSIELGKATKESTQESEGYKTELAKLSTPTAPLTSNAAASVAGGSAVAAGVAASSAPKKSTEIDEVDGAKRVGSTEGEEDLKKNKKSRSTSRGVLNRFRSKKDELEQKVEEKKEEKKIQHEEKKAAKEEKKAEEKIEKEEKKAAEKAADSAPVTETAPAETHKDEAAEAAAVGAATGAAVATEEKEKPKPTKRGSIFGSLKAGFKSPVKEKEQKDAELKPEAAVSDVPPQLPETATATESTEPLASAAAHTQPTIAEPTVEPQAEKETTEAVNTPSREKKTFLSGLPFINKRDRSVSPSAPKEESKETKVEGAEIIEATRAAEAANATPAVATETKAEEKAEETSPATNKRQSVLGGLGRRASKMMQRVQPSKKENVAPAETKAEEPVAESTPAVPEKTPAAPAEATAEPVVENKPEPVTASGPAPVAASA